MATNRVKESDRYFFIFLLDSTLGSDVKSEKILLVAIFLHPILAVWKHEI